MTKEEQEAVALFRYGLIAPILNQHCDRKPYLQEVCAKKHERAAALPTTRSTRFGRAICPWGRT